MPKIKTGNFFCFSMSKICRSEVSVCEGSNPRSASFAPSSIITAFTSPVKAHSKRAAPCVAVSPETPPFIIVTSWPLAFSASCNLSGKLLPASNPRPAVKLSPNAKIVVVPANACPHMNQSAQKTVIRILICLIWKASPVLASLNLDPS